MLPIVGIERVLEAPERAHQRGAVHPLEERAARAAVTVLARDGAAELEHQIGDLVGDRLHLLEPARRLEVDHRPDVQATDRAVAVIGARGVVLGEDVREARHELLEMLRLDARVLDEGDRLLVALHAEQQAEAGLAQLPDRLLLGEIVGQVRGIPEALTGAPRLERLDLALDLPFTLARVFDDQDRAGIALHERRPCALLDIVAREVEDQLVGELDGVGAGFENRLRGLQRLLDARVMDHVHRGLLGTAHQAHLRLEHGQQRALGADEDARHVDRSAVERSAVERSHAFLAQATHVLIRTRGPRYNNQLVQVVAGHAAPVLGIARADLVRVLRANRRHLAIDAPLGAVQPHLGLELRRRHGAEPHPRAVGQQGVQLEHVFDGQAVRDRVRPTGVVAEHPAERRAVGRRGVGTEE